MSPFLISVAAFVGVSALVGAVAVLLRERTDSKAEDRIDLFTGNRKVKSGDKASDSVLAQPLNDMPSAMEEFFNRLTNLNLLFEQAHTSLQPSTFFAISAALGTSGAVIAWYLGSPFGVLPVAALFMSLLPAELAFF